MSTKVLPNYKDKKSHYCIGVFLIAAILAIKKHCYICAFMSTKVPPNDKYPYGKPQTDEVARGSGNREYGCRRLREKLPNFSGVSFF